jgi:cation transport regulator ChaB
MLPALLRHALVRACFNLAYENLRNRQGRPDDEELLVQCAMQVAHSYPPSEF